jgi:NAD-dependent SIR2 family protein deacetylase
MQHREFVEKADMRRRYWARSLVGWPRLAEARPNAGHAAIAQLEAAGIVEGVITQNVDSLHDKAGSREVVELHGSLARVRCLECGELTSRHALQHRLLAANPAWSLFDRAELLLVAGSSLTVFSGYRFVRRAAERGVPVAIVNLGPTRGDPHAQLRIDERCGIVLPQLARAFS